MPYSGGSRAVELGLISETRLLLVAWSALMLAALIGVWFVSLSGPGLLAFGLIGAFSAFFYTAPPVRLAAREGLGELFVGLKFGPLLSAGAVFALTGTLSVRAMLIAIPAGLLTTAILWVNEFPDAPSDARNGKNNLVVVLGRARARWGYITLLVAAYVSIAALVIARLLPSTSLATMLTLPLAWRAGRTVMERYDDRALMSAARDTILLHALIGGLLVAGVLLA